MSPARPRPVLTVEKGDAGLRAVRLRKSYRKRLVLRDVSLELGRGEVVALLGPNGSGKTTCFYAIAGLITPEAGQVIELGADLWDYDPVSANDAMGREVARAAFESGWRRDVTVLLTGDGARLAVTFRLQPI